MLFSAIGVVLVAALVALFGLVLEPRSNSASTSTVTNAAWQDDFDGAEGSAPQASLWKFNLGGGGWGNNELQDYTSKNATLDGDSHLAISATIRTNAAGATSYRSSSIATKTSFGYGTLTARIQLPTGKGLLPAFWLVGANLETVGWPETGEIDVVETPNSTSTSFHNIHGPSVKDASVDVTADASATHAVPLSDGWHDYSVTRAPGSITISLDDAVVATLTKATMPDDMKWVFDAPFRPILSLAIGGDWPGDPDDTTPATSTMLVDWLRFTPAK
jgi:beta-glucanase (GH16 family)